MEQLTKPEPQELRLDDAEESKSSTEQWTDTSMVDKQPQSLIMQESPLISRQSPDESPHSATSCLPAGGRASPERRMLLCRYPEFRALQSQLAHLRIENEELRRQLGRERRGDQRMPNELKWLIYFRAPASHRQVSPRVGREQDRVLKAQVLAVVRVGLEALFEKDPSFRGRECATFWAAQERSDWRAFRIDYAGFKLAAFRASMKAAHANAQLPDNAVRTTQPPSVSLYR